MDDELLSNTISRYGLRELHVARMGAPVEAGKWCERIPDAAMGLAKMHTWIEEPLGVHHLLVLWPAREAVHLRGEKNGWNGRDALLWKLDKGQSLCEGAIDAAVVYLEKFGRWPNRVAMQALPRGAVEFVIYSNGNERATARPVAASWAPSGYLVMYEEEQR